MKKEIKEMLEKQQYRLVGEHSASKACEYVKKSIRDEDVCYKQTFYGIQSHRCVQMTPTVNHCPNECIFCWRAMDKEYNEGVEIKNESSPEDIIKGCIEQQLDMIVGFKGNEKINKQKFEEAQEPLHFAISLSGEHTLYPRLKEMIQLLDNKKMTSFVVTNGMYPERLEGLEPTQLYVSVFAPDKELYKGISKSSFDDSWERLMKTLEALNKLRDKGVRTCLRITLINDLNMVKPEKYAELIKKANPMFVEVQSYMWVGFSQLRLEKKNMPLHEEAKEFAERIAEHCDYDIIDEKRESRVVLLMKKEDLKDRFLKL